MSRRWRFLILILVLLAILACQFIDEYVGDTDCCWSLSCCKVIDGEPVCETIEGDGNLCGSCPAGTDPVGRCMVVCINTTWQK